MDFLLRACKSRIEVRREKRATRSGDAKRRLKRSSEKERKGNALASGAEEGRDKLRKASGSCK